MGALWGTPLLFNNQKLLIMPVSSLICSCDWDRGFGDLDNCTPQTPGVDRCMVWICKDKVDSVVRVACDEADVKSGTISDVVKVAMQSGYVFYANEDTLLPEGTKTVNDNGNVEITETVTGNGTISNMNLCWMEQHLNKEGYLFILDNDGELYIWDVRLQEFTYTWGAQQGDVKAIQFTFSNDKRTGATKYDPTILGTYADIDAFLNYIIA